MPIPAGILFAFLTAVSFGGLTTLAILYYRDGGNVLTLLLFRFIFAALALLLLLRGRAHPRLPRRHFAGVLAIGVCWSLSITCYLGSVHYIAIGVAALILYTFPVLVLIASLVMRELRSSVGLWAVFLAAFAGLALMLLPALGDFSRTGLLLAFAASALFAVTFSAGARISRGVPARIMALWITLVGLALAAPAVYWSGTFSLPGSSFGWLWLGAATVLYLIGVLSQFSALARAEAAQISMIMNIEPVVTIALAAGFLGERMNGLQWLGAGAVLTAMLFSQRVMPQSAPR
ncbi:MAG: DMT family transporter [Gammaproteobacteria bacterium]